MWQISSANMACPYVIHESVSALLPRTPRKTGRCSGQASIRHCKQASLQADPHLPGRLPHTLICISADLVGDLDAGSLLELGTRWSVPQCHAASVLPQLRLQLVQFLLPPPKRGTLGKDACGLVECTPPNWTTKWALLA